MEREGILFADIAQKLVNFLLAFKEACENDLQGFNEEIGIEMPISQIFSLLRIRYRNWRNKTSRVRLRKIIKKINRAANGIRLKDFELAKVVLITVANGCYKKDIRTAARELFKEIERFENQEEQERHKKFLFGVAEQSPVS